ncbi:MAG TPA: glutamate--tRNA ligase [Candidatus Polarisedimenticolia bacterium]|nr:glutamate--tRNA ligase [Candidatus Polarisedimenticolia bacterium]
MSAASPRVRFAPSPTGFLHVGGARTALFNWLFARREGGTFILRIEDTDLVRSSDEMVQAILDGLAWLGITYEEGPLFQTSFREEHVAKARRLEETGRAYRCFCAPEALETRKRAAEARGAAWKYDRACRALRADEVARRMAVAEPSCVRFLVPEGVTTYEDLVHGRTSFANTEIEDLIILRTDGTPTYNLSCVSDDIEMRITHVIRGDDHISNTPKQILLYEALETSPPAFGHLPLILGEDKKRLSKRHGAVSVMEYQRAGYLPEALFNFLALLGWSPGGDREVMTREEMISLFSFSGVGSRSAVFDTDKLGWMNGEYLKALPAEDLAARARPLFEESGLWSPDFATTRTEWYVGLVQLLKDRSRLLSDIARDARPFLTEEFEYDAAAAAKHLSSPAAADRLRALAQELKAVEPFDEAACEAALRGLAQRLGVKAGDLIHPARVALTGRGVSPGIFAVMVRMGREAVLRRLDRAIRSIPPVAAAGGPS